MKEGRKHIKHDRTLAMRRITTILRSHGDRLTDESIIAIDRELERAGLSINTDGNRVDVKGAIRS